MLSSTNWYQSAIWVMVTITQKKEELKSIYFKQNSNTIKLIVIF